MGPHVLADLIRELFDKGALDGFDLPTTICNFLLPASVILKLGGAADEVVIPRHRRRGEAGQGEPSRKDDSLHGLGGFHGSVHIPTGHGGSATLYFAVGAYSAPRADGRDNGIVSFPEPWKNIACMQDVPLTRGSGRVPVQFQYSNFVHGPEGPTPKPRPFSQRMARGAAAG